MPSFPSPSLFPAVLIVLAAIFTAPSLAQGPVQTIHNDTLTASYDGAAGTWTLGSAAAKTPFVVGATLTGVGEKARTETVTDFVFGKGQAIVAAGVNGTAGSIRLFPHLPFALVSVTLKNSGAGAETLNHVPIAALKVDLGLPASALKTLGTGGLSVPGDCPGSYAWLAVADPQSRRGVVAGWLTGDRASGVLLPHVDGDTVSVTAQGDYGRLLLMPGESAESETLAVGGFADARLGLEAWADAVARQEHIHLPPQPSGFCTWYTEAHGGSSDEKNLASLTAWAAKTLKPYGLDFVQIDDGWQQGDSKGNGPRKNFTGFRSDGPYPAGMKATADDIRAHGLTPGLWFMPFAGTENDPWYADKQALFVKRTDSTPYTTNWGGTSLDMTNPAAREYVRAEVSRIAHDWGYTYFKMDGLYTGAAAGQAYVNSGYKEDGIGDAVFADPRKTNMEAFRSGLKLVRTAAGPSVFFLGCTAAQNMRSYQGAFGLVDAMRVGADNDGSWGGWLHSSPLSGSRNYFLNGRIWYNDPDPFYVRSALTPDEARTTASWSAVAGGLATDSDWIPDLPADRLDIIRRTMPAHGQIARPVDLFENDPPRLWTVTDKTNAALSSIAALFNWGDTSADYDVSPARFGLAPAQTYVAFDYWANTFVPPFTGELKATLPAHGCRILAVHPLLNHPFLLSTSRHVTQGMTDVVTVSWAGRTLSGTSRVVGGDAYELRIYVPAQPHAWKVARAAVTPTDQIAEVRLERRGPELRMTIKSSQSRIVNWKIVF